MFLIFCSSGKIILKLKKLKLEVNKMDYDKILEERKVPEKLVKDLVHLVPDQTVRGRACDILLDLIEDNWRGEQITGSRLIADIMSKYNFDWIDHDEWEKDKIELSHRGRPFTDSEMNIAVVAHGKKIHIIDTEYIDFLNEKG